MSETDLSQWITKREAAARLGVAEKTIERLSDNTNPNKPAKIEKAMRKRPGAPPEAVYHPGDVQRVADEKARPLAPFVMRAGDENEPPRSVSAEDLMRAFVGIASQKALPAPATEPSDMHVPIQDKLYLTIREAVALSGLPAPVVRAAMKDGTLKALKTGAGWRVRRADLQNL